MSKVIHKSQDSLNVLHFMAYWARIFTRCGMEIDNSNSERVRVRWTRVTCKRCLATRKKGNQ